MSGGLTRTVYCCSHACWFSSHAVHLILKLEDYLFSSMYLSTSNMHFLPMRVRSYGIVRQCLVKNELPLRICLVHSPAPLWWKIGTQAIITDSTYKTFYERWMTHLHLLYNIVPFEETIMRILLKKINAFSLAEEIFCWHFFHFKVRCLMFWNIFYCGSITKFQFFVTKF